MTTALLAMDSEWEVLPRNILGIWRMMQWRKWLREVLESSLMRVPYVHFQHGIYFWVFLPIKVNEGQRRDFQVIRGILNGKHSWPEESCLSRGTLQYICGCRHTLTWIVHSIKMVLVRDVCDSSWTGERTQEHWDPTTGINSLGPPRQNAKFCTHTTGVILKLHNDPSNSYRCRDQHSVVPWFLR